MRCFRSKDEDSEEVEGEVQDEGSAARAASGSGATASTRGGGGGGGLGGVAMRFAGHRNVQTVKVLQKGGGAVMYGTMRDRPYH
jgi:uncharacterized membrane protein YebE (DUF533 family)